MAQKKVYYSVRKFAEHLEMPKQVIQAKVRNGDIPGFKVGWEWIITEKPDKRKNY